MDRIMTALAKLAPAAVVALVVLGTTGCAAEVYGGDAAYYPNDAFVATAEPVYYGGQATYYYGDRWYYRNGGRWSYYRSEPSYLREYRGSHPTVVRGGVRGAVRGRGRR